MSEWVFRGTSALALDAKGRINVPVRHRDPLLAACAGQLTLTRHPDGYLLIYPRPTWEAVEAELMALKAASDGWRRIFLGSAVGGVAFAEEQHERYLDRGIRAVSPTLALAVFGVPLLMKRGPAERA